MDDLRDMAGAYADQVPEPEPEPVVSDTLAPDTTAIDTPVID